MNVQKQRAAGKDRWEMNQKEEEERRIMEAIAVVGGEAVLNTQATIDAKMQKVQATIDAVTAEAEAEAARVAASEAAANAIATYTAAVDAAAADAAAAEVERDGDDGGSWVNDGRSRRMLSKMGSQTLSAAAGAGASAGEAGGSLLARGRALLARKGRGPAAGKRAPAPIKAVEIDPERSNEAMDLRGWVDPMQTPYRVIIVGGSQAYFGFLAGGGESHSVPRRTLTALGRTSSEWRREHSREWHAQWHARV
jgi:hypothetical protein